MNYAPHNQPQIDFFLLVSNDIGGLCVVFLEELRAIAVPKKTASSLRTGRSSL
jgi:hypothetical protein